MKQTVYLITDKDKKKFLCRNSKGRYWGVPNNIKDIIHYPTKVIADKIIRDKMFGVTDMFSVEYELELKELLPIRDDEYITVENEEELKDALDLFETLKIRDYRGQKLDKEEYFEDHFYKKEFKTFYISDGRVYTPPISDLMDDEKITPFKEFKKRF